MSAKLIERHLHPLISEALTDTPAVLVNGPRQCGKTTLVRQFAHNMAYFSLDDATLLASVRADPISFVRQIDRAIIDEIQRAPELLLSIKLMIDQDRRAGRFLLTGSANLMSLSTIADSLAGRVEIHTMLPLSNSEITGRTSRFLEQAHHQDWSTELSTDQIYVGSAMVERVLAGGYPEMRERATHQRRQAWAKSYITTLVERDIQDIAQIEQSVRVPQLLNILAMLSGQMLNLNQIGGQIGLNAKTVEKYVDILEKLFLVKRLPAWSRNELNRLIKTPKLHFLDAGLQSTLCRLNAELVLVDRTRFGTTLETWVYGELLKILSVSSGSWFLSHYRDKDQVEVDFVLESPERKIIGIEVKASATINMGDFRGLRRLQQVSQPDFISGIVLYDGSVALPFGNGLWAVPLSYL